MSQVGTAAWRLVLPWTVYKESSDPVNLAATLAVLVLPELLLSPLAGWVVDRFRRARVIAAADSVRCAVYLAVAIVLWGGNVQSELGLLVALTALDGVLQMVSQSARVAILNEVACADRPRLRSLLATDRSVRLVGDLVGPVLGGFLAALPLRNTLLLNSLSFGVAALSVLPLLARDRGHPSSGPSEGTDWRRGIEILRRQRQVADATIRQFVVNLCVPIASIGIPVAVLDHGDDTAWLGIAGALFASGAFVSANWQRQHPRHPSPTGTRAWLVVVVWVALLVGALTLPTVARYGLFLPVGAIASWLLIESQSQWQSAIEPEEVGRVAALASVAARLGAIVALAVVGSLVAAVGLGAAVTTVAAVVALLALTGAAGQRRAGPSATTDETS